MKQVKLFEQFILEYKTSGLIQTMLDQIEPTIQEMVNEVEVWFVKKFERPFSKFDKEMTRLHIIADMVKAVEAYTEPTDQLISISPSRSRKGSIEIVAQIQRDGTAYRMSTEAIVAGGYNIQRAHYRYLTNTNLPKTGNSDATKAYAAEIKRMSKAERINTEIMALERDIERTKAQIEENGPKNDSEIAEILKDDYAFNMPSWEQIIKNDAAKNYNNSEEEYKASMAKYQAGKIDFWKTQNVKWPTDRLKSLEKALTKEKAKLAAIM